MATYGDYLIDSGHHDITPEQEREIEAREECARRGLDPDDDAADGVLVWMVVDKELQESREPNVGLGWVRTQFPKLEGKNEDADWKKAQAELRSRGQIR